MPAVRAAAASSEAVRAPTPRGLVTVIGWGVVVAYLGWPQLLARLPLGLALKNEVGLHPEGLATFWAVATIPWYGKPLVGLVVDAAPLGGTRRLGYLVVGAFAGAAAWLVLAFVPVAVAPLLAVALAVNLALVVVSATVGALLVEVGQRHGATGRLSALRQVLVGAVNLVVGPLGGWLAGRALGWTGALGALVVASFVPVAVALVHEPRVDSAAAPAAPRVAESVRAHTRAVLRSRPALLAATLIFLVYVAPGLQTPLLYYQQDVLHFDPPFMGALQTWAGAGVIVGALSYGALCRAIPLRVALPGGIVLGAASVFAYLAYDSRAAAIWIHFVTAICGTLAALPLYDVAARAAPRGSESFGYASVLAMQTLATYAISNVVGSVLYERFHLTFQQLVWVDGLATLAVLLFVPALPRALLAARDGRAGSAA
jgi:predicted MFS family arabinose efflux permease